MERVGNLIESESILLLNSNSSSLLNSSLNSKSSDLSSTSQIPTSNKSSNNYTSTPELNSKKIENKDKSCSSESGSSESASSEEKLKNESLLSEIWLKVSSIIKPEIDEKIYSAWFKSIKLKSIKLDSNVTNSKNSNPITCDNSGYNSGCNNSETDDKKIASVVFLVPNKFSRDHLKTNYSKMIENCFKECLGYVTSVDFQVDSNLVISNNTATSSKTNLKPIGSANIPSTVTNLNQKRSEISLGQSSLGNRIDSNLSNLNTEYNFSNFVIGSCNQFAHAACLKVSESPGVSYNPLLIYGGVGLGKTHLANAIGNAAKRRGKKVLLVSSEKFVSELIGSIKSNSMDKFKSRFRSLDILIIDDIQFIIGKERTQEEFFHTFNELYSNKKQIILTSDKIPQEMVGLEERLRTRFASGLSVDLQAPDFETRVAILSKKAETNGFDIPYDIAKVIANRIDTNVRELEGALTRLCAMCSLLNEKPSFEIAHKVIDTIAPSKTKEVTTEKIKQTVAKQFNVSINDLSGKRRTQNIALARQIAMFLCRKYTARSFPEIGALFGGRDHSTVIHAIKSVNERLKSDISLIKKLEDINAEF